MWHLTSAELLPVSGKNETDDPTTEDSKTQPVQKASYFQCNCCEKHGSVLSPETNQGCFFFCRKSKQAKTTNADTYNVAYKTEDPAPPTPTLSLRPTMQRSGMNPSTPSLTPTACHVRRHRTWSWIEATCRNISTRARDPSIGSRSERTIVIKMTLF